MCSRPAVALPDPAAKDREGAAEGVSTLNVLLVKLTYRLGSQVKVVVDVSDRMARRVQALAVGPLWENSEGERFPWAAVSEGAL